MSDARADDYAREYRGRQRSAGGSGRPPGGTSHLFEPRPYWFQFASCRPEFADRPIDQWVDQFFPGRGAPTSPVKAICAECPAQEACAEHGLAEKFGIWGGFSERERRRLRRKLTNITDPAA